MHKLLHKEKYAPELHFCVKKDDVQLVVIDDVADSKALDAYLETSPLLNGS